MTEISKEKRISQEFERISQLFSEVAENQKSIVTPLLQNAAFMKATLEDLQAIINAEGVTEAYQNGANQSGIKQSASLQSYNALIKNYASVIKTLSGILPPERRQIHISEPWMPREPSDEELEEMMREEEEHRRQVDAEIARAVEYQRKQREQREQREQQTPRA